MKTSANGTSAFAYQLPIIHPINEEVPPTILARPFIFQIKKI
jgi:hypothetical protein